MADFSDVAGWLRRNGWLLLRVGIGLIAVPLVFRTSLTWFHSGVGAAVLVAAWLLLICSIVAQKTVDRAAQDGRIDSKAMLLRIVRVYSVEAAILFVLLAASVVGRLLWPSVIVGVWLLVNVATMLWLRQRYQMESPGKLIERGAARLTWVEQVVVLVWGAAIGFGIIGWLFGTISVAAALLVGAAVVVTWLSAKLATGYIYTRVRR